MMIRIARIWILVFTSILVSFGLLWISRLAHFPYDVMSDGAPMPRLSEWFYPPSVWPYLFPLPILAAGIVLTVKRSISIDIELLFLTAVVSFMLMFMAIFGASILLPWFGDHMFHQH